MALSDCGKLRGLRVVLDTNILISAGWTPGGLEARVVALVASGALEAAVSPAVLAEYRDVLARDKFAHLRDALAGILATLEEKALPVTPNEPATAAKDEDDNRLLECAAAAQADFLITGNTRHFPGEYGVTRILNAREFLDALGN